MLFYLRRAAAFLESSIFFSNRTNHMPGGPMTTAKIFAISFVLSLCILTGCAGTQSTTASNPNPAPPFAPAPTPSPSPSPTPTPTPRTQFLYTADSGAGTITGFRINPDGTLSGVSGSPFVSLGTSYVKGVGTSLVSECSLRLYSVNESTGAIQ